MDAMETTTPNGGGEGGEITIKKEAPEEESVAVKVETDAPKEADAISLEDVLAYLRNKGLKGTEGLLKQELGNASDKRSHDSEDGNTSQATNSGAAQTNTIVKAEGSGAEVSNVLSSYKSEGDPSIYAEAYKDLQRFVETSLDLYRHELALILVRIYNLLILERY